MADKVLILRTCNSDMTSYEGFVWPESGPVVAPDWRDDDECGHGLHGLLWGEGYSHHLLPFADAKWLVVEVERSSVRDLGGKCKFPCGEVSLCGSREEAVNYIQRAAPDAAVCFGTATAGYRGTAIVGDDGTATAGDDGTATAGSYGTATAGDWGSATAGYRGTATAGNDGTAIADYIGTATAGHRGTAIAGNDGTATAGDWGSATTDNGGTATVGYRGIARVGLNGVVTAGDDGVLISDVTNAEGATERRVAMVGQGGILPNTPYRCVQGEWEVVEEQAASLEREI